MADIINLRMARKARARGEAQTVAAENRARFGQDKASRSKRQLDTARAARLIDGARREDD
ncbi:DUF4169 family protein [Novosphingobium sp.]|uniref:DUF4169 family protein n=1 Tax=Novosphingobium sp. TaxID=1874826 RepID=UPI00273591C9|nr:DUF4169 family protein [Novosphingobium sp.]MDP3905629.1 DUF4169 family protein [Novosphingobium sp.]